MSLKYQKRTIRKMPPHIQKQMKIVNELSIQINRLMKSIEEQKELWAGVMETEVSYEVAKRNLASALKRAPRVEEAQDFTNLPFDLQVEEYGEEDAANVANLRQNMERPKKQDWESLGKCCPAFMWHTPEEVCHWNELPNWRPSTGTTTDF